MTQYNAQLQHNAQLQQLLQQTARQKHLERMLEELYDRRTVLETTTTALEAAKQKEQTDVDRLEGRSLTAFFYGIIGKKDDKLDKERREAYEAAVKYDAAAASLQAVQEDIRRYEAALLPLQGCEARYQQTLQAKADALKSAGTPEAEQILRLEEQLGTIASRKEEISEAITEGTEAERITQDMIAHLNQAKEWADIDLFLNSGFLAEIEKHSHLDTAQDMVEQLQIQLERFRTELTDVEIHADMQLNVDGFTQVADYVFDGLFMDLSMLDHISQAQQRVEKTQAQITQVLEHLNAMLQEAQQEYTQTKKSLDDLIADAAL